MKDLVYKVHQMPETFHNYILPSDQKRPPREGLPYGKIIELSATEEFEYTIQNIIESDIDKELPISLSNEDPITSSEQFSTSFNEQFFTQINEYKNQEHEAKKSK
jgi:hypothetical protein